MYTDFFDSFYFKESRTFSLQVLTVKETNVNFVNGELTESCKRYPLQEVTHEELMQRRLSRKPIIIFKDGNKLYCANFRDVSLMGGQQIGEHLCGECSMVCKGCPKVKDWTIAFHIRNGKKFKEATYLSGRIEKYPFINLAIETFNCSVDAYLILECSLFKKRKPET